MIWDMVLAFGTQQPLWYWRFAGTITLILDSTSISVNAVEVGMKVIT
jgi:hypothetical protein